MKLIGLRTACQFFKKCRFFRHTPPKVRQISSRVDQKLVESVSQGKSASFVLAIRKVFFISAG